MEIPNRSEIDDKYKWSIEDLYSSDEKWEADFTKLTELVKQFKQYNGKIKESAQALYDYYKLGDEVSRLADRIFNYSYRRADEDTSNSFYQNMKTRAGRLAVTMDEETSYFDPELMSIEDSQLDKYYSEIDGLKLYKKDIDNRRRFREHILDSKSEKIIAMTGEMAQAPSEVFSLLSNADLKFPSITDGEGNSLPVTHGTFISLMQNENRNIRKAAFESLYSTYDNFKNTFAALLSSQCNQLNFNAKVHNYPSALHAALDSNNVPVEVYHNLISAVHENMNYMYKYIKLRKKLLGVDTLHMYDVYAPLIPESGKKITFDEARENVEKAMSVFGPEYSSILRKGFEDRWMDIYENTGKRSGAYSAGAKVHPYVLLNHKDDLDSEFTLAHEMGHAMHSYLSNTSQPDIYSEYVIFVAEVASTCNESLLMQYLLKNTEDKLTRANLINHFLEQFRGTLYRQTMFAEFELKINTMTENGESLTAETICSIYKDLVKEYFGDDIVIDDEIALEWARIPHFYYNYYVFQYATGFSAAIALSQRILKEGKPAVEDYLNFLRGGCSKDPVTLLKEAGVDMMTKKPVDDALKLFNELIDELDSIMS